MTTAMNIDPRFYRVAAICSLVSAVTTSLLIFLPYAFPPVAGFEDRMQLVHDPAYRLRAWVYLLHPFLVVTAALGVALSIARRAPVLAIVGMLGFLLWSFNEALQQTLTLFAFDEWRAEYAAADERARLAMRIKTEFYDGLWDAMYFLLLIGFTIGNLAFASVLLRERGLARICGCFLLAAVVLTLTYISGELNGPTLPAVITEWSYPAIQPLGRTLLGFWLWRGADAARPPS